MMAIPRPLTEVDGRCQVDSLVRSLQQSPASVLRRAILLVRTPADELWVVDEDEVQRLADPERVRILYRADAGPPLGP